MRTIDTQCCIAGGGPAGMMLGYLLARAGVQVVVLEKHADFLRDFRGDTVHPSTLTVMDELGLLPRLLQLPHQKLDRLEGWFGDERVRIADFAGLPVTCPYIAFMPQWDFLDFLADEARQLPGFTLLQQAEVQDLLHSGDRVSGVSARAPDGPLAVHAALTVGADGRHSTVRERAALPRKDIGAPMDVMWFRVPRDPSSFDHAFTHVRAGRILITLDRGDYWQCAYVIAKGSDAAVRARGLDAFRATVADTAPALSEHLHELRSWDEVKLLTVTVDRLERWSAPGLLCIGDAAHAMSPIGGVGINLAIQDAVASANLLAAPLRGGRLSDDDVARVQQRRRFPTVVTQAMQVRAQNVLKPLLQGDQPLGRPPLPLRLLTHSHRLREWVARFIGLGARPEHVAL